MQDKHKRKRIKRSLRHARVRSKVFGTAKRPRLSVFRGNQHIHAQLIDDDTGKTLAQFSSLEINLPGGKTGKKEKKTDLAKQVGKQLAERAAALKIKEVVFDRGGYAYHGRVKALAEGAREGGLKF